MVTVKLNSRIDYTDGVIRARPQGGGRGVPTTRPVQAEVVERVVGYGESNAVVVYDGFHYLATIGDADRTPLA